MCGDGACLLGLGRGCEGVDVVSKFCVLVGLFGMGWGRW